MRSSSALNALLANSTTRFQGITSRRILKEPVELVHRFDLLLSDIERDIASEMKDTVRQYRERFLSLPDLSSRMEHNLSEKTNRYNMAVQSLDQLSPVSVMKRGYSIALDTHRAVVKSISQVSPGDDLNLLLVDGGVSCRVTSIQRGTYFGKEKTSPNKNDL